MVLGTKVTSTLNVIVKNIQQLILIVDTFSKALGIMALEEVSNALCEAVVRDLMIEEFIIADKTQGFTYILQTSSTENTADVLVIPANTL